MRHTTVPLALLAMALTGCATVFKGYESTVSIYGAPDSVRITTLGEVPVNHWTPSEVQFIPMPNRKGMTHRVTFDSSQINILLRSDRPHLLVFDDGHTIKRTIVYPKIGTWWFILDLFCGGLPAFVDIITSNWNYFEPVYYEVL